MARAMRRAYGRAVEDAVWSSSNVVKCKSCGKTSVVEVLTVAGWRENESVSCPICNETLAEEHCFSMHANIVKVF